MFESGQRGTEETMRDIRKLSFLKDLLAKAYATDDDMKAETFLACEKVLSEFMS